MRKSTRLIKRQRDFLNECLTTSQTLREVMEDFNVTPESLARWLTDDEFRSRLHSARRYLRKTRDLQLEIGSLHAAEMLFRCSADVGAKDVKSVQRAAWVDIIRLARDSLARMRAEQPGEVLRNQRLYHPAIAEAEANKLAEELAENQAERQPPAAKKP